MLRKIDIIARRHSVIEGGANIVSCTHLPVRDARTYTCIGYMITNERVNVYKTRKLFLIEDRGPTDRVSTSDDF